MAGVGGIMGVEKDECHTLTRAGIGSGLESGGGESRVWIVNVILVLCLRVGGLSV